MEMGGGREGRVAVWELVQYSDRDGEKETVWLEGSGWVFSDLEIARRLNWICLV